MSDNPIDDLINNVLGLGGTPKSFDQKIEGLRRAFDMPSPVYEYIDVLRQDKGLSSVVGSTKASSQIELKSMYESLRSAGLIPESARSIFLNVNQSSSIHYNETKGSLFFNDGGNLTALPLRSGTGGVSFGGKTRKVNSLLSNGKITPFIDKYYGDMSSAIEDGSSVYQASKQFKRSNFNKAMMGGIDVKGAYTPEEAFWTSRRSILDINSTPEFEGALNNFRLYNSTFTMLSATAGKSVSQELQTKLGRKVKYGEAFDIVGRYKEDYISALGNQLLSSGNPSSFVFTKPENLGYKEKFLVSSPELNELYGTRFEGHTLKKGLFQLAKLQQTSQGLANQLLEIGQDPTAPFILARNAGKASDGAYSRLKLSVGVVDTVNSAFSMLYFQDGGVLLTPEGAKKFAQYAPMGDLTFSSPSQELIASVERTFGINLGAGNVQSFSNQPRNQIAGALASDYNRMVTANPTQQGLLNLLTASDNRLAKVELTDSVLKLNFVTPDLVVPHTSEINIAGIRHSAVVLNESHPLWGMIPKETLEGIDVLSAGMDFNKNLGPDAFITNFIEKVRRRDDAAYIFESTFGHKANISMSGKTRTVLPMVTDATTAFRQAKVAVRNLSRGTQEQRLLAKSIMEGDRVVTDQMLSKGVKAVTVFGLGGASRTDFMGDINMMNPISITPSKMKSIATGSRHLGYTSMYQDPMYTLLAGSSKVWSGQKIGIRAGTGQLFISSKHTMSRYSKALMGVPGHIDKSSIVTIGKNGGFMMNGKQLDALPTSMDAFKHANGVSLDSLKGTILGQSNDLLYLDLGKERSLNILGTGAKPYRYLPIPIEYLRAEEGVHGRLVVGSSNPSHGLISSLVALDSNRGFYSDPIGSLESQLSAGYSSLNKAIAGKDGIFQKSNSILMPLGTRVRLTPQSSSFFDMASLTDASKLYTSVISGSDFNDYMTRKSHVGTAVHEQVRDLRKMVAERGYFYGMVSVDPMQRAEHANVMKIIVDKKAAATKGIGQLNLNMHPFWYLMTERDTDRDAAALIPFSGINNTGLSSAALDAQLHDRWLKQQKLSEHFMWFYKHQLMTGVDTEASQRFSLLKKGLVKASNAIEYLSSYLGLSRSLGYSIVRSSENVLATLTSGDLNTVIKSARKVGITEAMASDEMLETISSPFLKDGVRGDIAKKMFQNIYQGAVQKGSASPLEEFSRELVKISQTYKGAAYDHEAVVTKASEAAETLLRSASKIRSFTDTEYIYNNFPQVKESLDLMKADLQQGANYAMESGESAKLSLIKAQARILGESLGPATVLAASMPSSIKNVNTLINKTIRPDTSAEEVVSGVVAPAAGISSSRPKVVGLGEDAARAEARAAEQTVGKAAAAEASESFFTKASKYFNSSKGKTFGAGLGVGALLGAAIVASRSGPEAPMPREVDGRQPTDMAPDIFSTPPRIYGNNQSFSASRQRSSYEPGGAEMYNFPSLGGASITVRDRTSPYNPHMLEKHMRQASNSDYNY